MFERNLHHNKHSIFKVLTYSLKVNIKTFPSFFFATHIIGIFDGISYGLFTFTTQYFFDSIANVIRIKAPINKAYIAMAILILTLLFKNIINAIDNLMYDIMPIKTKGEMERIIHSKIDRISPIYFEETSFYDNIEKASSSALSMLRIGNRGVSIISFYIPYFVFMFIYLHHLKPQFILALILVFVPVLVSQFVRTNIISKFENEVAPVNRNLEYYKKTITDNEYYKETRAWGAYNLFMARFLNTLKNLGQIEREANKQTNSLEFSISLLNVISWASILYMLANALLSGEITVGAFAAVFNSIRLLFTMTTELIQDHIGMMANDLGKAYNFISFMNLPERAGEDNVPNYTKGIIADNISFIYPGSKKLSVNEVSLVINAGETIAIVGENGAGKSTLVKLLVGLYIPTEGKVIINGMNTMSVNTNSLFNGVTGVFQKFQRYKMTLNENIQISGNEENNSIDVAIAKAEVNIDEHYFNNGINTMLSREFGGVELSGGQWQRIAIARGLYRTHNVVILDEPTAAIDPIEESRTYQNFIEISKNNTAIIITHRLGSTKIADRVVVMEKGKIVDVGTHNQLLRTCSIYKNMYTSQAKWYQER
jgi:ABC-type bacteriocin/lantibiotic exporters, contain an N-terminal double-glycine peptidase domain